MQIYEILTKMQKNLFFVIKDVFQYKYDLLS